MPFVFLHIFIIVLLLSIQIMKLIDKNAVEGWQDEEGFHFGREDEVDRR